MEGPARVNATDEGLIKRGRSTLLITERARLQQARVSAVMRAMR